MGVRTLYGRAGGDLACGAEKSLAQYANDQKENPEPVRIEARLHEGKGTDEKNGPLAVIEPLGQETLERDSQRVNSQCRCGDGDDDLSWRSNEDESGGEGEHEGNDVGGPRQLNGFKRGFHHIRPGDGGRRVGGDGHGGRDERDRAEENYEKMRLYNGDTGI